MIPPELSHPPAEFSVMPFWFWNDELDGEEIIRQIDDFQAHGVDGFVIHPRVGLPRHLGWMSERLLGYYHLAIREAHHRGMKVVLYDEGMYPSGSSSGQVVAEDPTFACRCLAKVDLEDGDLPQVHPGENLVALVQKNNGKKIAVIDRPANSYIRGLHYIGDGPQEDEPPAGDILNPNAVAAYIRLVYDKFAEQFSSYFGNTVIAIFTDEPGLLGRSRERNIIPGTTGILTHINRILGYDFTPHLPAMWDDEEPEATRYRRDYTRAINARLEETYYQPLFDWCEAHGIALTGHPAQGDDIGPLRFFHIPGQDLVWRWVLPDQPTALEGSESTQAKCAASAMLHHGRRRNANECCGAYGHELTWDEMNWLARWTLVRGGNLLFPHAFYYSVRGPRWDERPPDVGPHSKWWNKFIEYALECRRLSWINTDSKHVCSLAILGQGDFLPWRSAKTCFTHQVDFNYIDERDLVDKAAIDAKGIHLAGMTYNGLIYEHDLAPDKSALIAPLRQAGAVFHFPEDKPEFSLIQWLERKSPPVLEVTPQSPTLRIRHVVKNQQHYYLLFNEERVAIDIDLRLPAGIRWYLYNPALNQTDLMTETPSLHLDGYQLYTIISEPVPAAA